MEKTISVKDLDVLYYDKKLLPVTIERKKGKVYARFLLNNTKVELENLHYNVETYNQGALGVLTLKIVNDETRYAEIGTLLSTIACYGARLQRSFPNLYKVRGIVKGNIVLLEQQKEQIINEYFKNELTETEIKSLFENLNKEFKLQHRHERVV